MSTEDNKDADDGPMRLESLGPQTPTLNTTLQQARNVYSSMTLKQLQQGYKYRNGNQYKINQLGSVSSDTTSDRYYAQRKQQLENIKKSEIKFKELQAEEEEEAKQQLIQKEEARIRRIQEQKMLQQRIKAENQARRAQSQLNFKQLGPNETNVKELIDFFQKPRLEYQQQLSKKYNKLAISKAELKQQNQLIYYGILDGKADKYKFDYNQCKSILKPYIDRKIEEIKHNLHQFKGREIYESIFRNVKQQSSNRSKKSLATNENQNSKQQEQKNKNQNRNLQNQQNQKHKNNLQQHDIEIILHDLTAQSASIQESKNQLLKNLKNDSKSNLQTGLSFKPALWSRREKNNDNNKENTNNTIASSSQKNDQGKQNKQNDKQSTKSAIQDDDKEKIKNKNSKNNKSNNQQSTNNNGNKKNSKLQLNMPDGDNDDDNKQLNQSHKNQNNSLHGSRSQQDVKQNIQNDMSNSENKQKGATPRNASHMPKKADSIRTKNTFQLTQYNDKYNVKKSDLQNKQQVQQIKVFTKAKKYQFSQLECVQDLEQIRNVYNMFQIYTFQIEILEEEFKIQHKQDYQCNMLLIKNVNHQLNIQTIQKDINDIIQYLQQLLYDDRQSKNQNNSRNALNDAIKQLLVILNKKCAENIIQNFCLVNQEKYPETSINRNTFVQFHTFLSCTTSEQSKFVDKLVSKMRIFIKQLIFQYNKNNNFSIKNVQFLEQLQDKFDEADLDQFAPQLLQELSDFIVNTYVADVDTRLEIHKQIREVCHTQSYLDKITVVLYDIAQKQNKLILFNNFVNFIARELFNFVSSRIGEEQQNEFDDQQPQKKEDQNLTGSTDLAAQLSMKLESEKQKMKAKQEQLSNRYRYK